MGFLSGMVHADHTVFFDDFESGSLNPAFWSVPDDPEYEMGFVEVLEGLGDEPIALVGRYAVVMGSKQRQNAGYINYLDLHLDLSGFRDVALEFWIRDLTDATNLEDGLWFSDDGGEIFRKVLDFRPSSWRNAYGRFPPIDVDGLASRAGVHLTSRFVIRFAQKGTEAIGFSHGFLLDDVHVYQPEIEWATLPFHDGFETGRFGPSWRWAWPEQSFRVNIGGRVRVEQGTMVGDYKVLLGQAHEGESLNALDLHLDLSQYEQVTLNFMIWTESERFHIEDGIWISDDGGQRFVKIYSLSPNSLWDQKAGPVPPIDISWLAREKGLQLTNRFIIRFQQYEEDGYSYGTYWEGICLDEVSVTSEPVTYMTPPFSDGFESGRLSSAWAWRDPSITAPADTLHNSGVVIVDTTEEGFTVARSGVFGVRIGKSGGSESVANVLDLHLALANFKDVTLSLWLWVYREPVSLTEGFWFSNDGGETFVQAKEANWNNWPNQSWNKVDLDVDALASARGLALTDKFVIRLQQVGNTTLRNNYPGGLFLDDVQATGVPISNTMRPVLVLPWLVNNSGFSTDVAFFNSGFSTARATFLAVDRDGRERSVERKIPGQSLFHFSAGELFPDLNGYSLLVSANLATIFGSYLTFNLEPVSGGHAPSLATAYPYEEYTDKLLFGFVPGDETAALVLVAPDIASGMTEVNLTMFDAQGPVQEVKVHLIGRRPLAALVQDIFDQVPLGAAIRAETLNGSRISGTTFVFNHLRQPSMEAAIPLDL